MSSSKVLQLRTKAVEASKFIRKNGGAYYKHMMEKNKEYVQDPPSIENCTKLAKQLFYTRLASIPNRYEMLQIELKGFRQFLKDTSSYNLDNCGLIALFGVECYAWSWLGEVVGRGFTITGYHV